MELHISTDDATFATSVYEFAEDNLDTVDGYVSLYGTDRNGKLQHKVQIHRSHVGNQFPKRLTFGQMLDIMKQAGTDTVYFQREDWRNTHNCLALNNSNISELYLEIFYEDNRYAKGYKPKYESNEVPMDSHPYIPTYADMFIHSWIVYGDKDNRYTEEYNDEEKNVDNSSV